ncbi:MAG: hypothetical protein HKN19_16815 [Halioglobus sp.]|nr:hypothetical protein [Halioglobus sp.]
MLTESSYLTAIYVYTGAALLALVYFAWCMRRRWRAGWLALVVLLGAALLLTPAYPREGVDTMAPALIVAGFALFTEGFAAAEHALRPLAFMSGLAVVLAIILRLTLFRRRPGAAAD